MNIRFDRYKDNTLLLLLLALLLLVVVVILEEEEKKKEFVYLPRDIRLRIWLDT